MSAITATRPATFPPAAVGAGLIVLVTARWLAFVHLLVDPVLLGLGFGIGLLAVARLGGLTVGLPPRSAVVAGLVGGALLVVVALLGGTGGLPALARPATPFAPWALATVAVATAEEGVFRGALFDGIATRWGPASAVLITTVAFAAIHVPFYGWPVLPLDLGVGLMLAGLRLTTGSMAAPAVAHAIADLATWWL